MFSKNYKKAEIHRLHLCYYDTIPRTLNNNSYHSNKWGPPLFPDLYINPVISHALIHSVNKTHVGCNSEFDLVVVLEYTFFQLCCNTEKNSVKSYVNRLAVVLTNHSQSYTAFLLDVCCSKWSCSIFCTWLFPVIVHLRCWAHLLSTPSNVVNCKLGWETNRCEIVINISNLTVGVSILSAA